MRIFQRMLAVATVLAAAAAGVAVTAAPAAAALPYCNNVSIISDNDFGTSRYQTYVNSSGVYSVSCDMNGLNENGTAGQRRAIKQLQWDLIFCYGQSISYDGEYGPGTKQAVKNVQTFLNRPENGGFGLSVDGWAGPNTRKAMKHVRSEQDWCSRISNPQFDVFTIYYVDVPDYL